MADSVAYVGTNSQLPQSVLKNDVPTQAQVVLPSQSASSTVFRDIPSINGRYSLGGEPYCRMLGLDLVEVMRQSLIGLWAGPLSSRLTPGFEVSLGKASPRMSSKWASAFRFE